ncbi:MAG: ion channel [Spirochaetota bacterium]|nr:ion channel [Spirochaetota bacterium]
MFIIILRKFFTNLKKENIPIIFAYAIVISLSTSILFYYFENRQIEVDNEKSEFQQTLKVDYDKLSFPSKLKDKISYNNTKQLFVFKGLMSEAEKDILLTYSKDVNYTNAINNIFNQSEEKKISYGKSIWWTIVTFTTVGYGDIYPLSIGGKIVAVFAMVFGIGFIGTFMATVANIIIQARGKELRGMKKMSLKNHLIICGYNKLKVEHFVKEFRSDPQFKDVSIVILTNSLETHPMPDEVNVHFVKGESTDDEALNRAGIQNASKVIVLAESNQDSTADEKTILTVMLIEEINPGIYTCAEILSPMKKGLLKKAHCDEIITVSELSVNLMVQALQDPGVPRIIEEIVSNTYGQQIHKSLVPKDFHQKTFYDLLLELLKEECIVLALDRNGDNLVNPPNNTILKEGDTYYYIAKTRKM